MTGLDEPIAVQLDEQFGTELRIVYCPTPEVQEFLIFYEKNEPLGQWNKAILGKWNEQSQSVQVSSFIRPTTIPLSGSWRSSLVTWQLNSPVDEDTCYERYKLNRGANFSDQDLYLIDLSQQIAGKPVSEALFDPSFSSGDLTIKKYQSVAVENDCQLNNEETIQAEIENLRVVPPGELPEDYEFEILSLNFIG